MQGGEVESLQATGTNLLLIDCRGYGSSTRVTPNEATVDEDARAALDYVLHQLGVPIRHVFLLGRSIGSGPATQLAYENTGFGGLILESPFTSIDDAAKAFWYLRILPLRLLLHTHFDNLSKIRSISAPLLVVSGTADTLTPAWMAEAIFARAHQPKQLYLVPGASHDNLLETGGRALTQVLRRFVEEPL